MSISPRLLRCVAASLSLLAGSGSVSAQAVEGGADQALITLFDTICGQESEPDADFRPVTSDDIPQDLANLYIGPQEGRYWRRAGALPAFIVKTRGPGHWFGIEEYCIVAVQGARFEPVALALAERMRDRIVARTKDGRLHTWDRWGMTNVTVADRHDKQDVLVTKRPDGWVSLFTGGQVYPASRR